MRHSTRPTKLTPTAPLSNGGSHQFGSATIRFLIVVTLGVSIGATGVLWAQKKNAKWRSDMAGDVPTEFGELVSVTGDAQITVLTFKNSKDEIRVVRMRGNKLPRQVTVIGRSGDAKLKSKWKQVDAGVVPAEYGPLVEINGDAQSTFMAFKNSDNEIRTVLMRGAKLPDRTTVIKREY